MREAIFLTGGSGFVGQNLIPHLIRCGYSVYALARSDAALRKVKDAGAIGVRGDLFDLDGALNCMKECKIVIHCAAYMNFLTFDYKQFERVNVRGTQYLLEIARNAEIRRFIYISAASVVNGAVIHNVDESYQPKKLPGDSYSKSKALAEQLVLKANQSGFETIALRPPLIWGPNNPQNEEIRQAVREGRWVWIGGGKHTLSTIHVDNLAAVVIAAINWGGGGEFYYVTDGEQREFKQFFMELLQVEGINPGHQSIPRNIALVVAYSVQFFWQLLQIKTPPPITPVMVHLLGTEFSVSDRKARTQMRYQNAISIDEGLRRLKSVDATYH